MTAPHSASGRGRPRRVTLALLHRAPSGGVSAAAYQGAVPVSRPFRRGTKAERRRSDDAGVGLLAASGCSHPPDARAIRSRLEFRHLFTAPPRLRLGNGPISAFPWGPRRRRKATELRAHLSLVPVRTPPWPGRQKWRNSSLGQVATAAGHRPRREPL